MKKYLASLLMLAAAAAHAQFNSGQVLTAAGLNTALAAPTITGGSINNAPIGQTSPAAGKFTSMNVVGNGQTLINISGNTGAYIGSDLAISRSGVLSDSPGQQNWIQFDSPDATYAGANAAAISALGAQLSIWRVSGGGWVKTATFDGAGNLGLGVNPMAWGNGYRAIEGGGGGSGFAIASSESVFSAVNAYRSSTGWTYSTSNPAYLAGVAGNGPGSGYQWFIAPSGTAGNPITWTQAMTLDGTGNLMVGTTNPATVGKLTSQGVTPFVAYDSSGQYMVTVGYGDNAHTYSPSASASVMTLASDTATGRSMNATGTINASGADYAEYMRKAPGCGELKPGQLVGVDSDGNLTDRYSASVSFLIVSTDPSYVGGDTWGSEKALGMARPTQPASNSTAAERAKYVTDKARFDALLALAQSRVAIIAYAGQVPVNVKGAKPGQYIIPARGPGDTITGSAINAATMKFSDYVHAVGIVQNVLHDGRANVRVKVL